MSVYVSLLVVDHQEIPACHVSLQECILAKDQCKIDEDQNKSSVYNLICWSFKERLQAKTTRVWKACHLCMFRFWEWISIIIHGHETKMSFWRASPNPEVLGLRYSITWKFTHLYPSSIPESATYLLQFELFSDKSSKTQSSGHFDLHQKSSLSGAKDYIKGTVQWGRLSHSRQTTWLARKVQMLVLIVAYKSRLLSTHGGVTKYKLLYTRIVVSCSTPHPWLISSPPSYPWYFVAEKFWPPNVSWRLRPVDLPKVLAVVRPVPPALALRFRPTWRPRCLVEKSRGFHGAKRGWWVSFQMEGGNTFWLVVSTHLKNLSQNG